MRVITTLAALLIAVQLADVVRGQFPAHGNLTNTADLNSTTMVADSSHGRTNLSAIEQEMSAKCSGATSNNWAVDYVLANNYQEPINIDVKAVAYSFNEIDDLYQRLSLRVVFTFSWELGCPPDMCSQLLNGYPRKDQLRSSISILRHAPKDLWHPRVRHDNFVQDSHPFDSFSQFFDINPCENKVTWVAAGMFDSFCSDFSFSKFPFDTLNCSMVALMEVANDVIQFRNASFVFSTGKVFSSSTFMAETEIWEFVPPLSVSLGYNDPGDFSLYSYVSFHMAYKRKYTYFICNIFIPTTVLIILQIMTLLMPPDLPDRPTFSVTIVLANAVVMAIIFGDIPRTSETVHLISMVMANFISGCVLTVYLLLMVALSKAYGNKVIVFVACQKYKISASRVCDMVFGLLIIVVTAACDITFFVLMIT